MPKTHSFVSVQPENVILTVIKKTEDSNDIVLRLYETCGRNVKATIMVDWKLKGARETNLLENETAIIPLVKRVIEVLVSKNEIKTIKTILHR